MNAKLFRITCALFTVVLALTPALFAQGQRGEGQRGQGQRGQGGQQAQPAQRPQPLPTDLFTSKSFYKDQALWSDPLYFRCNSPRQLTDIWTRGGRIGSDPPRSAEWGDCSMDYSAENIKSKLPYKTAKAHYEALLAEAKAAGGPTIHTRVTLPDWDGRYNRAGNEPQWIYGRVNQVPTILSLLTPEYSNALETVEVFTPRKNADGSFAGLTVDMTFYDPEAFVAPLHAVVASLLRHV